jgi:hypothetical protein
VVASYPAGVAVHLAISALFAFQATNGRYPTPGDEKDRDALGSWVRTRATELGYKDESSTQMDEGDPEDDQAPPLTFWDHVDQAVGEM